MDKPRIFFRLYPGDSNEPTRRRRGLFVVEELMKLGWDVQTGSPDGCDIAVLQRLATPDDVRKLQASGIVTTFETNDLLAQKGTIYHIPDQVETIATADFVVVTCRYMQQLYARINPRTLIAPEALEPEFWETLLADLPESPLVLSWHGMPDNLQYIEPIIEELKDVGDLRLRIIMPEVDSKRRSNRERVAAWPVPVDFVVWQRDTFVHEMAQAHAGMVVLPDTSFCRSKGQHKCCGYFGLNIPVIASNMPGYREVITHGENGLLAETPDQWREAIERIRDPGERQRLGGNARELSEHFRAPVIGEVWDRLLSKIWQVRGSEAA